MIILNIQALILIKYYISKEVEKFAIYFIRTTKGAYKLIFT